MKSVQDLINLFKKPPQKKDALLYSKLLTPYAPVVGIEANSPCDFRMGTSHYLILITSLRSWPWKLSKSTMTYFPEQVHV